MQGVACVHTGLWLNYGMGGSAGSSMCSYRVMAELGDGGQCRE